MEFQVTITFLYMTQITYIIKKKKGISLKNNPSYSIPTQNKLNR